MSEPVTVIHPDLGECSIITRSPDGVYIQMPQSGRCFWIPKNEPERTKAIKFVQEIEKEPFFEHLLPN